MANLFKKAAVLTDIHFGAKGNSDLHNEDCMKFLQWFCNTAKENDCEICIFTGDYHNNRNTMNLKTMNYAVHGLELLSQNFDQVFFIPGNHDLFFKDKRDVHSTEWAKHIPKIKIITDWFSSGDVVIAPWLVDNDYKKLKKHKGKYIFGHFELPGFLLNSMIKMPDHGEVNDSHFSQFDHCFSGHFHKRQSSKNITYLGNCFPHNYSDAGDDARGMMILEWGKEPTFISWPDQPTYRLLKLSTLLSSLDQIIPNQYIKATMDIEISFEESTMIKEQFVADYGIRELILLSDKKSYQVEESEDIQIESIDKTIATQISSIQSDKFDKNLLISIFNHL